MQSYLDIVEPYIKTSRYPGSPLVAAALVRTSDKAFAGELHPHAFTELQQHCRRTAIKAQHRDGFEMLKAMLPPTPNRGAVLIDPPYESAGEYQLVTEALTHALKRWPIGIYMLWYPLLSDTRVDRQSGEVVSNPKAGLSKHMLTQISELNAKSILNVQFASVTPNKDVGMYGSGMCIINPPWQIEDDLQDIIEFLVENLLCDDDRKANVQVLSKVEWLKVE